MIWTPAHVRAWIETILCGLCSLDLMSPAHVRAWIETSEASQWAAR